MPQSSAALRQKAEALRVLKSDTVSLRASAQPPRPIQAKVPHLCQHGTCLALELRTAGLWVLVRDKSAQEGWAPVQRILNAGERRAWARTGFG
jgi:hypothetical protein